MEGAIINLKTMLLFDMYQVLIQEIVPIEHSWGANGSCHLTLTDEKNQIYFCQSF